jgi:formate--tetrahydrofolate ligase
MPRVLSNIISPVPSDIDVAQAIAPLPIAEIAESIGLSPDEYDMHGKYKGKARDLFA